MTQRVVLPYQYFPDWTRGRPVYNGSIYIGEVGKDPETDPVQAYSVLEDGSLQPIPQPIPTGPGGVPQLGGSPIIIAVDGPYSLRVRDRDGGEVYYAPDSGAGGGSGGGTGGDFIPLAGTAINKPITGPLEFNKPLSNGAVTLDQAVNFFGSADAMVFRSQGVNTGFVFSARTPDGVEQSFSFSPGGTFVIPSIEASNTESWSIGAATLFDVPNTLLFVSQNALGQQTDHNIAFSCAPGISFVMHQDAPIGGSRGWLQLPRATNDLDDDLAAATKSYVDAKVPEGGGEDNVLASRGGGAALDLPKEGATLPIKTLVGGTSIDLVEGAETITINASGGGGEDFLPLSGTVPGKPITGTVVYADGSGVDHHLGASGIAYGGGVPGSPIVGNAWQAGFGTLGWFAMGSQILGYAFECEDSGGVNRVVNFNQSGQIKAGIRTIDAADDNSVLTLGWWKDDVLNAAEVNFGGTVNSNRFVAVQEIQSFGQVHAFAATPSAASHLTRKDYVDNLDGNNVKLSGSQTVGGAKTFTSRLRSNQEITGSLLAADNLASIPGVGLRADTSGFGFVVGVSSDIRLKENIVETAYGMVTINAIDVIEFDWKDSGIHDVGFSAQQLITVLPEAVHHDEENDQYGLKEGAIIATLVKSLQEASSRIEDLEARLATLEARG